jgi:hypothetical protein
MDEENTVILLSTKSSITSAEAFSYNHREALMMIDIQTIMWMPALVRDTKQHRPDSLQQASRRIGGTHACNLQRTATKATQKREPSTKTSRTTQVEVCEACYHHIGDNDNE